MVDSASLSSTQDSMQSDSSDGSEIPVQNDIWFAKDTVRYEDYLGDVSEEAERIRSGYYLDIQESLDTCLRYYDYMENPFYKVHMGAVQYLQYWKHPAREQSMCSEDDSSSHYSTSFIDTSPDTSLQFESPETLKKGESVIKMRNGRKRLDSDCMSGIGLLSSSSSTSSTINEREDSLPKHMDNERNNSRQVKTVDSSDNSSNVREDICEYKEPPPPNRLPFRRRSYQKNTC